jgi:hypothetical protein
MGGPEKGLFVVGVDGDDVWLRRRLVLLTAG